MNKSAKIFLCEYCDYKSNRRYNLTQHVVIKHIDSGNFGNASDAPLCNPNYAKDNPNSTKDNPNSTKDNPNSTKDNPDSTKDNPDSTKDNPSIIDRNQCDKCEKVFAKYYTKVKHIKTCKGKINPLQCQICDEIFTLAPAKYRHQKKCIAKDTEKKKEEMNIHTLIENQNIENNITNNVNNNINNVSNSHNTQNINLISFSTDVDNCNFVKTEAFHKKIRRLLKRYTSEIQMIKDYNKELYSIKDNQCIKKTNLRSMHTKVHIGNNKWVTRRDKDVYPQLVANYANDLCNMIIKENNREKYRNLEKKLDYFTDGGYINDTEDKQREITNEYNDAIQDIKVFSYDENKNEIKPS